MIKNPHACLISARGPLTSDSDMKEHVQQFVDDALSRAWPKPKRREVAVAVRCSQLCWGTIKHLQKTIDWKTGFYIALLTLFPSLVHVL